MSTGYISPKSEIIDSRDVIARIEELKEERQELEDNVEDAKANGTDRDVDEAEREYNLFINDEGEELQMLLDLESETNGYVPDWEHGEALIHEDHFVEYAQQLAEDIGAIDRDLNWPYTHIDWNAAAEELKQDYIEVEYDDETFLIRG